MNWVPGVYVTRGFFVNLRSVAQPRAVSATLQHNHRVVHATRPNLPSHAPHDSAYNIYRMHLSRIARLALAILSGAALALAFPNFNLPLLAWISVSGLMLAAYNAGVIFAGLCGFLYGMTFYCISTPWIYTVLHQWGPLPVWQALGVMLIMASASAVFKLLFAAGISLWSRSGPKRVALIAPFLWVSIEYLFDRFPNIGFPWNLLGHAAARSLAFVQITTITGIYGLSFLVAAFNALVFWAILQPAGNRRNRAAISVAATAVILVLIALIGPHFIPTAQPERIAHLVQPDFPQSMEYPSDWMALHRDDLDDLEQLSVSAARLEPGPIIWPETPAPFSMQEPAFARRAASVAQEASTDFIFGAVNWKLTPTGFEQPYNSAVQLDPAGREVFVYDKIHLVPFGEFVPWRRILRHVGHLTADLGEFHRGTVRSVSALPGGRYSVFICYEAIFAGEIRQFANNGAELLINISNDGWFGRTAAPVSHLEAARVRAVESRRWLLRDTNNGFTASIDPYGRIVAELAPDIRGELDAPYAFRSDLTFYVRHGDWLPWLSLIVVALSLLIVDWRSMIAPRTQSAPAEVPASRSGAEKHKSNRKGSNAKKSKRR
jgi:apolipoprotein N-acyltransferase